MKDITIKLNASEASGEAYWRKRCDVVEAELSRLRAANAELRKILARALAEEKCGADGVFFTVATECTEGRCWHFQARAALSRAEQAEPETCGWIVDEGEWHTACGNDESFEDCDPINTGFYTYCPFCGKRIEVAGKAEGSRG